MLPSVVRCGIWKSKTDTGKLPRPIPILEYWPRIILLWLRVALETFGLLSCFIRAAKHHILNIDVVFYIRKAICRLFRLHFRASPRVTSLRHINTDIYWLSKKLRARENSKSYWSGILRSSQVYFSFAPWKLFNAKWEFKALKENAHFPSTYTNKQITKDLHLWNQRFELYAHLHLCFLGRIPGT